MKTTMTTRDDGVKIWRNEKGELHREDGPAILWPDGSEEWFLNGKRHRDDGPAEIWGDEKCWWVNGLRHCEDGPAITHSDGTKIWWVNGLCHRKDGPAIIRPDGYTSWHLNGQPYREDGPAVIYPDGTEEYWLNRKLTKEEFLKRTQPDKLPTNNSEQESGLNQQLSDEFKELIAIISAQQTAISLAEVKKFKKSLEKRNKAINLSLRELEEFTSSRNLTPLIMVFLFLSGLLAGYLL